MTIQRFIAVPTILFFFSFATIAISLTQAIQIPIGALPSENARLATVPISHFFHALGGTLFGLIGPIQFGRVLARNYGNLHRIMGRVFVLAGFALVISSITLLWKFPTEASLLVSGGRLIFGLGLAFALTRGMMAIRRRDFNLHRNWMIRAYALGIGATAVSMIFIPIYAITGQPPLGLTADSLFIGSWAACVVLAEWIVRTKL